MNRTELRREFEIEYSHKRAFGSIPFYELFESNKNFEEYLFEDFLKCKKIPCARLYNRIYFSGTEYQESLNQSRFDTVTGVLTDSGDGAPVAAITNAPSEYSKLLRKSCIEFENLRFQNKLPEIYFMHDLGQSKILKILNRIQELISDTQMYLSRSTHEPYMLDLVDSRCKEILSLLESLNHSDLKKAVLESMINEDCSIFIANDIKLGTIELVSGEKPDYVKWNIAKDRIKQILKNNLQPENNHLHQLQSNENACILTEMIHSFDKNNVTITTREELNNLIRDGRTKNKRIDIKGQYIDFYKVFKKYIPQIPKKYYKESKPYKLISENFTRNGKEIPSSTISNGINSENW